MQKWNWSSPQLQRHGKTRPVCALPQITSPCSQAVNEFWRAEARSPQAMRQVFHSSDVLKSRRRGVCFWKTGFRHAPSVSRVRTGAVAGNLAMCGKEGVRLNDPITCPRLQYIRGLCMPGLLCLFQPHVTGSAKKLV